MGLFLPISKANAGQVIEIAQNQEAGTPTGWAYSWMDDTILRQAVFLMPGFNMKGKMWFRLTVDPTWKVNDAAGWLSKVQAEFAKHHKPAEKKFCTYGIGKAKDEVAAWNTSAANRTCHDNGWYKVSFYRVGGTPGLDTPCGFLEVVKPSEESPVRNEGWLLSASFVTSIWDTKTRVWIRPDTPPPASTLSFVWLHGKYSASLTAGTPLTFSVADLSYSNTCPTRLPKAKSPSKPRSRR